MCHPPTLLHIDEHLKVGKSFFGTKTFLMKIDLWLPLRQSSRETFFTCFPFSERGGLTKLLRGFFRHENRTRRIRKGDEEKKRKRDDGNVRLIFCLGSLMNCEASPSYPRFMIGENLLLEAGEDEECEQRRDVMSLSMKSFCLPDFIISPNDLFL